MSYGVFQEYYKAEWQHLHIQGEQDSTGVIGTTTNGGQYELPA